MRIYFEQIPEYYNGPSISVTIHYKPESASGLADELAEKLKEIFKDQGGETNFYPIKSRS